VKRSVVLFLAIFLTTVLPAMGQTTQCIASAVAGGTPDAITIPALPCGTTTNLLILTSAAANATTTPTLQPLGGQAQVIIHADGTPLAPGDIAFPYRALLNATGSSWILLNPNNYNSSGNFTNINIAGTLTVQGLSGLLNGNGTSPVTAIVPGAGVAAALAAPANTTGGLLVAPAPIQQISGIRVRPTLPDTIDGFYTITSTAGVGNVTLVQNSGQRAFAFGDGGKLITCTGLGTAGLDQGYYNGAIQSVTDGTHVVLTPAPALSMSNQGNNVCSFGSDQTAQIQAAWTAGAVIGIGSTTESGHYLVSSGLTCLPQSITNNLYQPPVLCNGESGSVISLVAAAGAVTSLATFGGNFPYYLNWGEVSGLTLDCGFVALYCADFPAGIGTRVTINVKNAVLAGIRYGQTALGGVIFDGPNTVHSNIRRYYY